MRLIGNKTKLLGQIEKFLADRGVVRGCLIDIFSGTASVGRHFKRRGFRVIANDALAMCYAQAVAKIEVCEWPSFEKWRASLNSLLESTRYQEKVDAWVYRQRESRRQREKERHRPKNEVIDPAGERRLAEFVYYLNTHVEPLDGLFFRNFSPGGGAGRQYFTDENGRRLDGIVDYLRTAWRDELLDRQEFYLALSALIDAADRVANISGTYGAFLKSFQSNARRTLVVDAPEVISSPLRHEAHREDSNELISKLRGDVLYIDPPYNRRQYAANYHILEMIAEYHQIDDLDAYEARLYGRTGLRPYDELKSLYCIRPSSRQPADNALSAMQDLILKSKAQHVLVSYNEEGLISREELGAILARFSGERRFDFRRQMREVNYRRFRSDADREEPTSKGKRQYKVLDGRAKDELSEWLFFASRSSAQRTAKKRRSAATPG